MENVFPKLPAVPARRLGIGSPTLLSILPAYRKQLPTSH